MFLREKSKSSIGNNLKQVFVSLNPKAKGILFLFLHTFIGTYVPLQKIPDLVFAISLAKWWGIFPGSS